MEVTQKERHGVLFYSCDEMEQVGFAHGFSTRVGGVSPAPWDSLNLGAGRGDEPERVSENFRRFCHAIGADPDTLVKNHQIHSDVVRQVGWGDQVSFPGEGGQMEADGLITGEKGLSLCIFTADCIPVLLCDPVKRVALWEQNFTPVDVDGRILIRAPFHASQPGYELEVVVMPRMAFGSGHHATTCLVASALCDLSLTGKRGLDMGCGTGVLAIVAAKRGAATVDAVDIDEWAEANCRENAAANGLAERIAPMLGDVSRIAGRKYDFIAANINRNILTMDMPAYAEALDTGGDLLMSGFLEEDVPVIEARARACGLEPVEVRRRDGWAMVHVKKA